MREQACVINQRPWTRFSVVTYALATFRYFVTGMVAFVLALLLVLLNAVSALTLGSHGCWSTA
jgi:hypothetical protein